MLVHHFGSKERLISEALAIVRRRQVELVVPAEPLPLSQFDRTFRNAWARLASPEYRRYFLLNHELLALAMRDPRDYREFLAATTEEWRSGLAGLLATLGFTPEDGEATSTMYMASIRGLILDLTVTHDRERTDRAMELIAAKLKADIAARGVARPD